MLRLTIFALIIASIFFISTASKKNQANPGEKTALTSFKYFRLEETSKKRNLLIVSPKLIEQHDRLWLAQKPVINSKGAADDLWNIHANYATFGSNFSIINLFGKVNASNEAKSISKLNTDKLVIDKDKQTYHAIGHTKIISDGQLLTSNEVVFNDNSKNILLPKSGKLIYTRKHENLG